MTPRFFIEATGETVLIKPNAVMEFYEEGNPIMRTSITFSSVGAAEEYARSRRWKEIQPV